MTIRRGRLMTDAEFGVFLATAIRRGRRLEKKGVRVFKKVSRGQITKDWLPVPVAAAELGVTRRQIYALIKAGKLRIVAIP